jgi:sterol 3beta-glucosyltransferase
MSAIVHHAGPGTTAAALSAGKANVTVPHFASQYFYGYLIADLGVGPEPIARRRLTSERLARAISAATQDRAMQERAGAVAAGINAEDGVKIAIREIRRYFG